MSIVNRIGWWVGNVLGVVGLAIICIAEEVDTRRREARRRDREWSS